MASVVVLNLHALAVMVLALIAFILFTRDSVPIQTTSLAILTALVAGFHIVPFERGGQPVSALDFVSGFGHEALVAICALMVLGRGLATTGALRPVSRWLGKLTRSRPNSALLTVLVIAMGASALLNDTPVVVLMMPVLVEAAAKAGQSPSRTLLPMNYSVLIGGMSTTIGTSTNLLVVTIAADLGMQKLGVFDFFHVGALAALVALPYLWLVLPRLLPDRGTALRHAETFDAILHVPQESPANGMSLLDARAKLGDHFRVLKLVRGDDLELVRLPELKLTAGDRLHVRGTAQELTEFAELLGVKLHEVESGANIDISAGALKPTGNIYVEVVVTEHSVLSGRSLSSIRFADRYGVAAVGLKRVQQLQRAELPGEIARIALSAGDILLVEGAPQAIATLRSETGLLVLDSTFEAPRSRQAGYALAIMLAVVVTAALKLMPVSAAALAGVLAMVVTGCLSWREVRSALSDKVILLVASSLALGAALTKTGGTDFIASMIVTASQGATPLVIMIALMAMMTVLTNFVSNNAAAAIGTPVAFSLATRLGVAPEPLVLAVLFGANLCYVTPMAYQTNLLVMSAGQYVFSDFVRAGLPLAILMIATLALLLPIFFPF